MAAGLDARGASFIDPSGADGLRELSRLHQSGQISSDEFFEQVAHVREGRYSPDEVRRIHDAWLLGEYEGVGDIIDRIHHAGMLTASLSNTNQRHWAALQSYPVISRLKIRLASHELGLVKPDPAIYRAAEARFHTVGQSIIFFDDLLENIEAARTQGWHAVHVDHSGDTARQIETALRNLNLL
jgi:putative hydrolase of the HAD superfamily